MAKWGVYDTVDNVWLGTNEAGTGPKTFDNEELAKVAAQMADVQLRQAPGRCRAMEYEDGPVFMRDEKEAAMTPLEALERLERGQL